MTRSQQLSFKKHTKGKKGKNKGKNGKSKKGKGKNGKPMKSRKRQILAAASPKKTKKSQEQQDQEVENSEPSKPRKGRCTKESPAPVAKVSKASRKAKKQAIPTGGSKVSPKAKAKAKASPKAKAKASPKGKVRKSRAAATDQEPLEEKPRKRAKTSRARQRNVPGADLPSNPLRKDSLTKSLMDFALKFPAECEHNETHLKAAILQEVNSRPLTWTKLMFYWSRNGCGVKVCQDDWKTYKDHCSFSFNSSSAPRRYRLAVATRCAEIAAT